MKLDPPAIIKSVESRKERKDRIRSMYHADVQSTLERSRDRGKELFELRKQCQQENSPWTTDLAEIGIPRSTAHRDIRIYINWREIESELSTGRQLTPNEAIIWLRTQMEEDQEDTSWSTETTDPSPDVDELPKPPLVVAPEGDPPPMPPDKERPASQPPLSTDHKSNGAAASPPPGPVSSANGQATTLPKPEPALCADCATKRRKGQDLPERCQACAALRKPANQGAEATPPEPKVLTDAEGTPIPEHVLPAFENAKEITAMCRKLDSILLEIEELTKLPGGRLIRFESVKQQIKDAKGNLWANRATHICGYCHAKKGKKPCEACKDEGWAPKHIWTQTPKESSQS